MKNQLHLAALALLSTFILQPSSLLAQGSLTPPGTPAATMRTLDQIEPRTPISALPFTINAPGSYYVTTNLTGAPGVDGISIASGNVTLDLRGFTLTGLASSLNGIALSGNRTNVAVGNGTLIGWGSSGVQSSSASSRNLILNHLTISGAANYGIFANNASITDCSVSGSGNHGLFVTSCTVRNCLVFSSASFGIWANKCLVSDCLVDGCAGLGIYLQSATVSDCRVQNGLTSGIYADRPGCLITGNTCVGNNITNSASVAGIYVNDSNNRVENNFLHGNGSLGAGILVNGIYSGNVIIKNSVAGNGVNNYSIGGVQVIGPIISTAGTITNNNPWANFSF